MLLDHQVQYTRYKFNPYNMEIINKRLTREEFTEYLRGKDLGILPPNEVVVHHTWKPTIAQWQGERSILGLKRYYEGKGWPAGPHIFVAEDGIWLFTDIYEVGIHAGTGNAVWNKNGKKIGGYKVAGAKLESYSIGVEVVGNYDNKVWEGETKENALHVIRELKNKLNIDNDKVTFHRDYASYKSCPGRAITKPWLYNELKEEPEEKPDGHTPSPWAKEAWDKAVAKKIITDKYPQEPFTREQAMVVFDRLGLLN